MPAPPGADEFGARDQRVLWHPFTQMRDWCATDYEPLVISRGKGAWLYDATGKQYLDGNSSIWTNIHGHCHPHIATAIGVQAAQLDHSSFLGFSHPRGIE